MPAAERSCLSASRASSAGLAALAIRTATSLHWRGRAPLRPSHIRNSSRQTLEVLDRERLADAVQRVRQRARDLALVEQIDEVEDVLARPIQVGPGRVVDSPGQHVHRDAVLGEQGRDLDPDDHVGVMGDLHCAGDRVVVGQGDQIHPASLAGGVRVGRVDEGLGHQGARQEPAAGIGRGTGVQMQIDAGGAQHRRRARHGGSGGMTFTLLAGIGPLGAPERGVGVRHGHYVRRARRGSGYRPVAAV